jgi:SAM-dependent methyltransferase
VVLAGRHHGYFPPEEEPAIARAIQAARPDILLVGMTSPRKERFLARWGSDLDIPVCHGVGGSFDVLAGKVRRAPRAWQRAGLEWLYRVLQEPRRLWRRYLVTNTLFCLLLLREFALRQPPVPMTRAQACAEAQSLAADFMEKHGGRINVLEAGCGSLANFRLGNAAHIVGIDVSAAALARNAVLHERIQADLHTYDLGDSEYDLIVCWNVLEHLAEPARVLRSFFRAVRPGGLLLLAFPNIFSLKALVAKCSPLPTHRLLHRLAHGQKAGTVPGYEICPTYLRSSIAPRSILTLAVRHGLDMQSLSYYESGMQLKLRQRLALVGWPWKFLDLIVRSLSLGLISLAATDCVLALRRPGVSASPSRPSTTSAIPDSRPIASSATSSIHR